jgi:hypothetical protein
MYQRNQIYELHAYTWKCRARGTLYFDKRKKVKIGYVILMYNIKFIHIIIDPDIPYMNSQMIRDKHQDKFEFWKTVSNLFKIHRNSSRPVEYILIT